MADQLTGTTPRLPWVRDQLQIALDILDNPGGGLVFGYQALGQARAHLAEHRSTTLGGCDRQAR